MMPISQQTIQTIQLDYADVLGALPVCLSMIATIWWPLGQF